MDEHKLGVIDSPDVPKAKDSEQIAAEADELQIPLIGIKLPRKALPWVLAGIGSLLLLGWFFLAELPKVWFDDEGYYSHGLLIPFMAAAVLYARRKKIEAEPVSSSTAGLFVMVLGLLVLLGSRLIDNVSLSAFGFILAVIGAILFVFGPKIAKHCVGPVLFLLFMMPVLGWAIDTYTNPLQLASTKVSEKLLNIAGYETTMTPGQPTIIQMNEYTLNVGGPCSGFKLILSLLAFTAFFTMISSLGWKKNLVLFAISLPLALFINGLRIMLIGVVGEGRSNAFGQWLESVGDGKKDAGMVFHNYSGYITLIVCFVILHFIVRALEGRKTPNVVAA